MRLPGSQTLLTSSITLALGCGTIGGVPPGSGPAGSPDAAPIVAEVDAAPAACGDATFKLSMTQDELVVPDAVSFVHIKAWGAGGNGQSEPGVGPCQYDDGGQGGFTEAILPVVPGESLMIIVGQRGRAGMTGEQIRKFGFGQWGGGGLSGVFRGPAVITEIDGKKALAIAGGGGSADAYACEPGGTGNHANAGGMTTMQGGAGGESPDPINGGAGGFVGGAGGSGHHHSNGGTGYVDPTAVDSKMLASEPGTAAPPKTDDPDYDGSAGKTETSGLVVLHFQCEAGQVE